VTWISDLLETVFFANLLRDDVEIRRVGREDVNCTMICSPISFLEVVKKYILDKAVVVYQSFWGNNGSLLPKVPYL
jgi:hypothetical protein